MTGIDQPTGWYSLLGRLSVTPGGTIGWYNRAPRLLLPATQTIEKHMAPTTTLGHYSPKGIFVLVCFFFLTNSARLNDGCLSNI